MLGHPGLRRRTDREAIKARIREVVGELHAEHGQVAIVSGGANPLDSRWPERYSRQGTHCLSEERAMSAPADGGPGCIVALVVLVGSLQADAVPIPGPLEVRLDRAKAVVLGEVIRVENTNSADGTRWTRATLSVKEIMKGHATDTVESRSRHSEASHLGLDTVGTSGIWLIGADGRVAYPHGHLREAQKPDVQRIVKMLAERKWSGEVNGLKAWATAIDCQPDGRPGILFAVMNCSKDEIFVPRPNCRPGILTARLKSADGKDSVFNLRRGEPCRVLHCNRLAAGEVRYLISGYSYIDPNSKLPPGKYRVLLIYRNAHDGVRLRPVGVKGEPVGAWKGELRAPPIEMVLTGPKNR